MSKVNDEARVEYEAAIKRLDKYLNESTELEFEIEATYPYTIHFTPKAQISIFGDNNVDEETGELNELTVIVGLTTSVKSALKFRMNATILKKLIKLSEKVGQAYYIAYREKEYEREREGEDDND